MNTPIIPAPIRKWKCPACGAEDVTQRHDVHTQMHNCPAVGGLGIPLIEVRHLDDKPDGRQVIVPREDNGRVAAVRTERGDGSNDCTVFPDAATISTRGE